uniref:DNA-directed DNA polymerase n=1 Tax=Tanacetum cinerariifolium TaxID=118510 RepID=A0A6L2MLR8_TANCI|nr:DNA-directed DNA polymerase [Tanacetum cinerariifolium]
MNNNHNQEPTPHNDPPPMVRPNGQAPQTMEELCQPSINGRVQDTCQFHRLPGDDANRHIDKFLEITQHMKQNGVSDDALRLFLFPYSLTHHAIDWYDRLLRNSIHSFDDTMRKFLSKYFPPSMLEMMNKIFSEMMRQFHTIKAVDTKCETCGGPHSFTECPAVGGNTQETAYATTGNYNSGGTGSLPSNTDPNPREDLKVITTRSGVTLTGPLVSPPLLSKEVDREPKTITDQKLGDPGKFLIPCDFPELNECLALADLGASINLMLLSIWKKLSLPELTSTKIILELADRSTTRPASIAENVFVKVGKFHFPIDFVVVDYVVDPRVLLIIRIPFLRAGRALIDVYGEELTLHVDDEAITFKVGQTSKYSYHDAESINGVNVMDISCEEYVQEVLGFFDNFKRDIYLLEELLNNDPSLSRLPPKELNVEGIKTIKSYIDEPPKLELKDLPSHLEYAYLEGTDKLPMIIAKGLKDVEKEALLKEDYKPTVQSQRRVNSKIHKVIKKEVNNLLDAGMIYPIAGSPWVSPVHCVPKKGGITVVENENNELIPTRLVTGWHICIDYRKLNDATRKDHFPLPFMDHMLERLAGNEFYCFLDGFSSYFQIPIDPQDQEKTIFTCPYRTFAYRRMPFGLCNALGIFQRPMTHLLEKGTPFVFSKDFIDAFETLKKKLTEAPILVVLDWKPTFRTYV